MACLYNVTSTLNCTMLVQCTMAAGWQIHRRGHCYSKLRVVIAILKGSAKDTVQKSHMRKSFRKIHYSEGTSFANYNTSKSYKKNDEFLTFCRCFIEITTESNLFECYTQFSKYLYQASKGTQNDIEINQNSNKIITRKAF